MGTRSYDVIVEEVHSGDDLVALVDLGIDRLFKRVRLRLHGVDTPNAYRAKDSSEAGALREEVKKLAQGKCSIDIVAEGKGGWLVILYAENARTKERVNVNQLLMSRGFVYKGKVDGAATGSENS